MGLTELCLRVRNDNMTSLDGAGVEAEDVAAVLKVGRPLDLQVSGVSEDGEAVGNFLHDQVPHESRGRALRDLHDGRLVRRAVKALRVGPEVCVGHVEYQAGSRRERETQVDETVIGDMSSDHEQA